jgi:Ca-activated chloride channel family protein
VSFQQPLYLAGLVLVVALGALYMLAQRRRRIYTMRFTNLALLESVVSRRPGLRRHLPPVLFLLGATALVAGLAGPILDLAVARNDASVMLVIDTSGSMAATDVQPTRMDAARAAANSLLDQLPGNARVGLVSFSGNAILAAPISDNRTTVQAALDNLQPGGATAIGDALLLATQELTKSINTKSSSRPPAMIVLLTDGVSNRGTDPVQAAAQANAAHIPVQTVGIGSRDPSVTVHGQPVGGVDEEALQTIATSTGGKYYFAEAAGKLSQIYTSLGSQFAWRYLRFDATIPTLILGTLVVLSAAAASVAWFRVLP